MLKVENKKINIKGFTLLTAIVTTGILLLISFLIANIAYKQLLIAFTNQESQTAFYSADSGIECATYWDVKNPNNPGISAFSTTTSGSVACNNNSVITTNSQAVPAHGAWASGQSLIGGGGANARSSFLINLTQGCVIVDVIKNANGSTKIDSYGYNTCTAGVLRRYERGVTVTY